MSTRFIKVERFDADENHRSTYINPDYITTMTQRSGGATRIAMIDQAMYVTESPEQIIAMIAEGEEQA